jgi:hypothetical protein
VHGGSRSPGSAVQAPTDASASSVGVRRGTARVDPRLGVRRSALAERPSALDRRAARPPGTRLPAPAQSLPGSARSLPCSGEVDPLLRRPRSRLPARRSLGNVVLGQGRGRARIEDDRAASAEGRASGRRRASRGRGARGLERGRPVRGRPRPDVAARAARPRGRSGPRGSVFWARRSTFWARRSTFWLRRSTLGPRRSACARSATTAAARPSAFWGRGGFPTPPDLG